MEKLTLEEIAKQYAQTWSNIDTEYVDMGDSASEDDFFSFLVELAENGKIDSIAEYKEDAEEKLNVVYDPENITESMIIAKTYIVQMIKEGLYGLYEDAIKERLKSVH